LRVKSGILREAESDDVIRFDIRPRTSGLNRKLSVFTDFETISGNLRVEIGVIRDADSNDVLSFKLQTRTSGLNRKLTVFIDFKEINSYLRLKGFQNES